MANGTTQYCHHERQKSSTYSDASLNSEAAQNIVNLRIDPEIEKRVAFLAERANEGELTAEERDEYLSYVEAADVLAIFKLKARRRLDAQG